jgi:endonuclease/exonuclease/phosphatase family metal-dependent hydrolase
MWSTQGKEDTPERALQSVRLVELIQRIPSDRFVICGDFNLLPTSETFVRLRALGFRNLLVDHGITSTRTSLYTKSGSYADYVLVSERMRVHSFVVPAAPEVSDHRPLILECE